MVSNFSILCRTLGCHIRDLMKKLLVIQILVIVLSSDAVQQAQRIHLQLIRCQEPTLPLEVLTVAQRFQMGLTKTKHYPTTFDIYILFKKLQCIIAYSSFRNLLECHLVKVVCSFALSILMLSGYPCHLSKFKNHVVVMVVGHESKLLYFNELHCSIVG